MASEEEKELSSEEISEDDANLMASEEEMELSSEESSEDDANLMASEEEMELSSEENSKDDANLVKCEGCGKEYSSLSAKNQHFKAKHQGRRFVCEEPGCESESFVSKFAYLRHMKRSHKGITPSNTNEVYVSHKTEMSNAAKDALIDRLKTELAEKDQIIEELKQKVKQFEFNKVKELAPEIGLKALNEWIESSTKTINVLREKVLEGNYLLPFRNDEINELVSQFIANFRKPNGTEYTPDTIFYLVLSLQKYFLQNGKYLNIIFEASCKGIAESLDHILAKSIDMVLSSNPVITRIEEEYLWECCQLGAFSPEILVATIIYFNVKIFQMALEDQKQLKFSDIVFRSDKFTLSIQYKDRVHNQPIGAISGFRCPIKHYEYYLSKCSAEAKIENNKLLLSPLNESDPRDDFWFSSIPLEESEVAKYINRSKIVKEVIASSL